MGGRKHSRANQIGSAEKENLPPTKAKRTVSISGLFDQRRPRHQSEENTRDVLAPKSAGVSKRAPSKSGPCAQFSRPRKAENHPLYRSFAEATNQYRQGVAGYTAQQLEPVCNALIARVEGLNVNGQPLDNTSTLSTAEREAFIQSETELSKPLEEQTLTVQNRQKNGTMEVKLGHLMHAFENLVEQKRTRLQDLFKELRQVDVEMATAYKDVLDTESGAVNKERRQLDRDLDALAQEAYEAKEQTLAEVKQAREDEHAAATDEKRRLDSFLNSLE